MAKFRNVLVHLYDDVSRKTVQDILNNDLGDLRAFATEIYAYMDTAE